MEEEQSTARKALTEFGERLDALETALRPVLAAMDEVRSGTADEELPPLMRARVDATLAYALNAIFCMYLRTQGQDPTEHPVREEIARVRSAYIRIHEIDAGKRPRPRKRLPAALYVAEQELARVLSDGERALHHAANGQAGPPKEVGVKQTFVDSSDGSVSSDDEKKPAAKANKRYRGDGMAPAESSDEDSDDAASKAAARLAKAEKRQRKKDNRERRKSSAPDEKTYGEVMKPAKADESSAKKAKLDKKEKKEKKEKRSDRKRRKSDV
jgi:exosome complex protein LRP1